MTLTAPRPASPARSESPLADTAIEWKAVQAGLWVGTRAGEFAGMIEAEWGHGFVATTNLAKRLGRFGTVEQAQAAFSPSR